MRVNAHPLVPFDSVELSAEGLGLRFMDEIDSTIGRIKLNPALSKYL
ncbi:MAG: hypothetical protein QNK20_04750 [Aureibaculum sp.]|nr:hypothetical protein [Aureibaculum sp.]